MRGISPSSASTTSSPSVSGESVVRASFSAGGGYDHLFLPSTGGPPALHIHYCPGNPGICAYYEDFLLSLHKELGGRVSIASSGLAAHLPPPAREPLSKASAPPPGPGGHRHDLAYQIDFQDSQLRHMARDAIAGGVPVALVGHSIGAHICLELHRRYEAPAAAGPPPPGSLAVQAVVGIHPFLNVNFRSSFQRLALFVSQRPLLKSGLLLGAGGLLPRALGLLPPSLLSAVFPLPGFSPAAAALTRRFAASPECVANFLHLGCYEMNDLQPPPDYARLRRHAGRISLIYAAAEAGDPWAPPHHHDELRREVPGLATAVAPGGHSFCVALPESEAVAKITADQLRTMLPELGLRSRAADVDPRDQPATTSATPLGDGSV